uniref:Endonuclease/exonuclease/phosphatase domain-containing protein n=1 Tax=Latimeria chalumnae TaxID=7897 RepID=H3A6P9_LATCH
WENRHWGDSITSLLAYAPAGGIVSIRQQNSPFHCLSQTTDPAGCFIIVHGRWGSKPVTFASLYAPNIDDPLAVQKFFLKMAQYPSPWIVGGDFNCALDTVMDRSSSIPIIQTQKAKGIRTSMVECGLVDIWRHLHPATREYSHYSHAHKSFSCVDLFLISSSLVHRVKGCDFLLRYISDHSPVRIRVEAPEWRLDPQLLTRGECVGEIESAIQEFFHFNQPPASPPDAFKATIRGKIIALSSARKKSYQQRMSREGQKRNFIKIIRQKTERVASLQQDLNVLSSSKAERALLRTRSKFYARGDKAGKLLAWQLRREEADRHIPSIKLPDNTTSFVPGAINGAFQNYYSSLY